MMLLFDLSMPRAGSWNGKWSGDGDRHWRVRSLGRSKKAVAKMQEILEKGRFYYDFGDGWTACVTVSEVTAAEARKKRRLTAGFAGYDWMIDSIIDYGDIRVEAAARC